MWCLAAPRPPPVSKAASVIAVLTLLFHPSTCCLAETNTLRLRLSLCALLPCNLLFSATAMFRFIKKKTICLWSQSWCNVMSGARKGVESLVGGGGYRMCAISGQLCLHCSMSAGDDFTVASCHMTMTPLTPMSDAASDLGLDRVDDFTQMLASLRQQNTSASRT